ncbi:MAG: CPBP family intramembrane metalloprotease [Bacteroidales bacterium]|nr:CPBP family intramembrane metalloprotease [Bacteroidales bacterium]
MKFTFFHNTSPWYRFIFAVFIVFSLTIITYFVGIIIGIPVFRLSFGEISGLLSQGVQSDNIPFLKYIQAVQSIGTFLLPALLLAWLFTGNITGYLQLNHRVSLYSMLLVAFSLVTAIPLINFSGYLNSKVPLPGYFEEFFIQMEESYSRLLTSFLDSSSIKGYLVNMFVIAVLPAVCEEFLFRGVFQRIFTDMTRNKHFGIFLAAALFSLMHFQFSGLLPRLLLGVYFGYLLYWGRTLWLPIAAHFVNNAFAVTFYHFSKAAPGESMVDDIGSGFSNFLPVGISIIFFSLLAFSVYQTERIRQIKA